MGQVQRGDALRLAVEWRTEHPEPGRIRDFADRITVWLSADPANLSQRTYMLQSVMASGHCGTLDGALQEASDLLRWMRDGPDETPAPEPGPDDRVLNLFQAIMGKLTNMGVTIEQIMAEVTAENTAIAALGALSDGMKATIADLRQQLQDAGVVTPDALNQLDSLVQQGHAALSDILSRDTPPADTTTAGSGSDTVAGGQGSDTTTAPAGGDTTTAGSGSDTTTGGDTTSGADTGTASGGDTTSAGGGNDTVSG